MYKLLYNKIILMDLYSMSIMFLSIYIYIFAYILFTIIIKLYILNRDLSENEIKGSIPKFIGKIYTLKTLYVKLI